MKQVNYKRGAAAAIAFGALAVAFTPTAATAAPIAESPPPQLYSMTVGGYDPAVAEANGYQVITLEDGSQESIPVTAEAKAREASAVSPRSIAQSRGLVGEFTVLDEVVGDCGLSYLDGSKGANDTISYETGFIVRDAVSSFTWQVVATGAITGDTKPYAGGPEDAEWGVSDTIVAIGPGVALVPPLSAGAAATLVDGSICYSGGPSFAFG